MSISRKAFFASLTDEEKKIRFSRITSIEISSIEKRIGNILSDLDIDYTHNFYITHSKYAYQYDYLLTELPIIIEVQGDYWHASPTKYKPDDEICFPNKIKKQAKQLWKKDAWKKHVAKYHGYFVVYIWEHEITKKSDQEIISLLSKRIDEVFSNEHSINED